MLTSFFSFASFIVAHERNIQQATLCACCVTSAAWCCCTAAASLLSACCGNDKPASSNTTAPGPASGRKRSVALLFASVCAALAYQYGLAPYLVDTSGSVDTFVHRAWLDGCEKYAAGRGGLLDSCVAIRGNYRASAATTLFFLLAAAAAAGRPTANREAWPAKIVLYAFMLGGAALLPSDPTFSKAYFVIALGAFVRCDGSKRRVLDDARSHPIFIFFTSLHSWRSSLYLLSADSDSRRGAQLER